MKQRLETALKKQRILPVVTCNTVDEGYLVADLLQETGGEVLELTLRTPDAVTILGAVKKRYPDLLVGAGTVITPDQWNAVKDAGTDFIISPALIEALVPLWKKDAIPYLPGVFTPTEVAKALSLGFDSVKLFPAMQAGGVGMLKALGAVFPDMRFCPTGGITPETAQSFLDLPNVLGLGGSWLTPLKEVSALNKLALLPLFKTAYQA